MKPTTAALALIILGGCQQQAGQNSAPANEAASSPASIAQANEASKREPIENRVPLAEPKGPIDPKSTEAAGQVVQHYGALIEQGRFKQAAQYWGAADAASSFASQLQTRGLKHLEIGKLGDLEGAAGSIYVTMPVIFYGSGGRSSAEVILRRVNDVPGSTEEQRRWHIERIAWKDGA